MSRAQRAIIIGGGIAGPALAIFLARAGIEATIFEAYPRGEAAGSGLAIAPNGMRVLGALGLADEVIACGTPVEEFRFRNGGGRTLARYTSDTVKRFGFPTVGLRRPVLQTILHRAVEAEGIPMEYARQLVSIDQHEQGVVAHFADGSSAAFTLPCARACYPKALRRASSGLLASVESSRPRMFRHSPAVTYRA